MAFSVLPREDEYFVFFSQITEKCLKLQTYLVQMLKDHSESQLKRIKQTGIKIFSIIS